MSGEVSPGPAKFVTWRSALLIGSFCLNLLLLGALGVGLMRFVFQPEHENKHQPPHQMYFGIGRGVLNPDYMGRMAPAKAAAIHGIVDARRDDLQNLRRASIDARGDAMRLFTSADFNQPAFDAALARIEAADAAFERGTMQVISASAARLSVEERRAVVDQWRQEHGHGRGAGDRAARADRDVHGEDHGDDRPGAHDDRSGMRRHRPPTD
jgi:uncharacterized membrane protein